MKRTIVQKMEQVHDFAVKWLDVFREPNGNYQAIFDSSTMADDCRTLGFSMDCGQFFSARYGRAASDNKELKKIIHEVTDVSLLGSAIFSRWRYFNHWSESGFTDEDRDWFILALQQLIVLSKR